MRELRSRLLLARYLAFIAQDTPEDITLIISLKSIRVALCHNLSYRNANRRFWH
jgi:hypothetical protein